MPCPLRLRCRTAYADRRTPCCPRFGGGLAVSGCRHSSVVRAVHPLHLNEAEIAQLVGNAERVREVVRVHPFARFPSGLQRVRLMQGQGARTTAVTTARVTTRQRHLHRPGPGSAYIDVQRRFGGVRNVVLRQGVSRTSQSCGKARRGDGAAARRVAAKGTCGKASQEGGKARRGEWDCGRSCCGGSNPKRSGRWRPDCVGRAAIARVRQAKLTSPTSVTSVTSVMPRPSARQMPSSYDAHGHSGHGHIAYGWAAYVAVGARTCDGPRTWRWAAYVWCAAHGACAAHGRCEPRTWRCAAHERTAYVPQTAHVHNGPAGKEDHYARTLHLDGVS